MRAVKHTPQSEVPGNVLKLMLSPRSYEYDVTRLKRVSLAIMDKHSSPADDDVNLVLCVRRLFLWGGQGVRTRHQGRHAAKHGLSDRRRGCRLEPRQNGSPGYGLACSCFTPHTFKLRNHGAHRTCGEDRMTRYNNLCLGLLYSKESPVSRAAYACYAGRVTVGRARAVGPSGACRLVYIHGSGRTFWVLVLAQMLHVLFVLRTDELDDVGIGNQVQGRFVRKRSGVIRRVLVADF